LFLAQGLSSLSNRTGGLGFFSSSVNEFKGISPIPSHLGQSKVAGAPIQGPALFPATPLWPEQFGQVTNKGRSLT